MANITDKIAQIRQAIFGKDVRENIASGIESINAEVVSTTGRQDNLEDTFGQLIINAGSDNAQIVAATHDNITGQTFSTIGERMDNNSSQLEESQTQLEAIVSMMLFPLIIPEIDDTARLQRAIDSVKISRKKLQLLSEVYIISSKLNYFTDSILTTNYTRNGVQIEGENGTIIMASNSFPLDSYMLDLDGNTSNNILLAQGRAQIGNTVKNILFEGNGRACGGMRIRANVRCDYENLLFVNLGGTSTDAGIYIDGCTVAGQDDADSSISCSFKNVNVTMCNGMGVYGANNRVGNFTFQNCNFSACKYGGMVISFATLTLISCLFANNGTISDNSTGGFTAKKSVTGAMNRGLTMLGCIFEGNFWHDISLPYIFGFTIDGMTFNPYQKGDISATPTQAIIKIGQELATGGNINGVRIQTYSMTYAYNIEGIHYYSGASDITVNGISFGDGVCWNHQYRYITGNGEHGIALQTNNSAFSISATVGASVDNLLGDNSLVSVGTLFPLITGIVNFDEGLDLGATGNFTCKTQGIYEFNFGVILTGFTANTKSVRLSITKISNAVNTNYKIVDQLLSSVATDKVKYSGKLLIKLKSGDVVYSNIQVIGTEKVIDILRETVNDFVWTGTKVM